ncbi:MAG: carnitinyl-CoA dehydratase [Gammaproteobacteria bacterium]|uniref:Carnitinyl-CoA dehydratase n=1 Tax=Marinobacter litoralis TaxID=187981 RepID=A0A3M2R8J9_9GAMM|nr:enoyl-CoA hydratase-related protein [Marinobacter litoralis]MBR9871692.1 carnitinyl-CoA dehydratase [Gammaproteobacteria bacterium]RMJ01602.1 Carnitinyl-CoA dehydratase [Marinobacter litoralis]
MSNYLELERHGAVLEITLNRPKANTIDIPLSQELSRVFAEFRDDPELRVAIMTGAGDRFYSAGWDLNAVADGEEYIGEFGEGGFAGFPELRSLNKPVICAVNGMAVGAGFEMLTRADFVVAAEHAEFLLPEVGIGIAPDIGTFMLPKLLTRQRAMEVLMTRRRYSSQQMASWGLVNQVVPRSELMTAARALAERLLASAPLSLAAIKETVNETETTTFSDCYQRLRGNPWPAFKAMLESDDAVEGARAFGERRPPRWTHK